MPPPNPNWKPGDKIESPVDQMVGIDPDQIKTADRYKLLIGSIVPRPIALVATQNSAGQVNLAPFSFFNGVCSNPPCVTISIARKADGSKKDTLRNIEETKQFVVNTSSSWLTEPLVHSAGEFPYGTDEMALTGLTPIASLKVAPPRVKEAAIHFECALYKLVEIGDGSAGSATLVIGQIVYFHIHAAAYKEGKIDWQALAPLARLGGRSYTQVDNEFERAIPDLSAVK